MRPEKRHISMESLQSVYTSAILVLLLFQSLYVHVTSAACQDGRGEGDKWFDGCRWCVCQDDTAHCSNSECSELNSLLAPCENIGSRWWDGCYRCLCHSKGIDCVADRACVSRLSSSRLPSSGACLERRDDRCICGLDGVPSCTADAIDQSAVAAKTINLYPAQLVASSRTLSPQPTYFRPLSHNSRRLGNSRALASTESSLGAYRSLQRLREADDKQGRRGGGRRSSRRRNGKGGRRRQGGRYRSLKASRPRNRNLPRNRQNKNRKNKGRGGRRARQSVANIQVQNGAFVSGNEEENALLSGTDEEEGVLKDIIELVEKEDALSRGRNRQRHRETYKNRDNNQDYDMTQAQSQQNDYLSQQIPTLTGETSYPPSLLVTTNTRCRWGVRWYGGGLRCYCDEEGSITCGDPSFVAPSIDGFIVRRTPCEEGYTWEDRDNCQFCECQANGVGLCERSESCLLPFLITPLKGDEDGEDAAQDSDPDVDVTVVEREDLGAREAGEDGDEQDTNTVMVGVDEADAILAQHDRDVEHVTSASTASKTVESGVSSPNSGEDLGSGDVDKEKDEKSLQSGKQSKPVVRTSNNSPSTTRGTTVVHVVECRPGRRWMERRCLRCECDTNGRKSCDDSWCPRARPPAPKPIIIFPPRDTAADKAPPSTIKSQPLQIPPKSWSSGRSGPVKPAYEKLETSCGRFRVGQRYWSNCNFCKCTPTGPRCTAMSC